MTVQDALSNRALIRIWKTHFGQKPVIKAPVQDGSIDIEKCHTLALHVHREITREQFWSRLIAAPAKVTLGVFKDDKMSASQVFSRRWTLDGKQCEPRMADAFSVLVSVDEPQLEAWLAKSEDGSDLSSKYRILWLGKQMTDAISTKSSLENHSGLILKPPNSFGARIHVDHLDEAWAKVKGPSEPVPKMLDVAFKYQVSNLPPNVRAKDLEEWSKLVHWPRPS